MKFRLSDILVCVVLLVCIVVLMVAVKQGDEKEDWINWPKLYTDCSEKESVEEANRCAEFGYPEGNDEASLECFERCLR
ncbi:MAG: hypothetical protein E3J56_00635 [Candidatus Aminicenantes bacterium]|nr:MAG: hypothetical protein E3J56_00635 [Candidatus Aminicenantes bacterium]